VADGADATTLRRAVGHVPWTAFPGEQGNVGLAGHRDSFFRKLEGVRKNDLIRVSTPDGIYAYRVESTTVVEKRRVDVLAPSPSPQLTLVTCFPFHYVGSAPKRFIVRARQIEPDSAPDRELASERPGQPARTESAEKAGYSLR
jgi:sortase A